MKEMTPKEMVEFLNVLASKIKDDNIKMGLAQCSIYIHVVSTLKEET